MSKLFAQSQPGGTRGIYFNGEAFVQIPNSASLNLTSALTIEAWIKLSEIPDDGLVYAVVSKRGSITGGYQFSVIDDGKLSLVLPGSGTHTTLNDYITTVNRWYHVAVSFDNLPNGVKFFVDGNLVEELNGMGLPTATTEPLRVGANNLGVGSDFFKGQIDAVRISNNQRYTVSFAPPLSTVSDANAVAVYNFDETAGQTITDQSSFGNNGWLGTNATLEPSDAIRAIRTINANDSGAGSLRQAILDANFDPDLNYLDFSIPSPSPWVISPLSNLPNITAKVILDGTSQLGWSPTSLIELNGANISVPPDAVGLRLDASSQVYGMEIYNFTAGSQPVGILCNAASSLIGKQDKPNVIRDNNKGIVLVGADGTTIAHNFIGTDNTGNLPQGNTFGIESTTSNDVIITQNVIAGNQDNIRIPSGNNNLIVGNRIGVNAAGNAVVGSGQVLGIFIGGSSNGNTIGGTTSAEANIIGGNNIGVRLFAGDNNVISGNYIGTDFSGTIDLGNGTGVEISSGSINNQVGGSSAGEGNVIAFNAIGISIDNIGINNGNLISQNAIYCNTSAAISLGGANANNNKPAPVILAASPTSVSGTAQPGDVIEIFRDNIAVCGAADQGRVYVATVTADGGGNWSYTGAFPAGSRITATATDGANNTSPFSQTFPLPAPYVTIGNATWNANGNWSLDGGITDCGCNPAGQNDITVILNHLATVTGAADIGVNNIIQLQDGGELFLQVQPNNPIAEIKTDGVISTSANLRFGYVPVSNNVVIANNLDNTNHLVAVIFSGGDGNIPARLGTEATPKPYPSVIIDAGNKTMQFPAGVGNYFINGNLLLTGGATLSFNASLAGNTLEIIGSLAIVTGGATLNANSAQVKLLINNTLRNAGGTINGSLAGLEFKNQPTAQYQHQIDGGDVPTATWGLQSQCLITGAVLNMPGGWAGQTFGNLIWNCNNQQTYMAFDADFEVAGTLNVVKTRNPSFPVALSVASAGNHTVTVGNFEMNVPPNDANFYPYGGTNPSQTGTLEIKENCTIIGGGTGVLSGVGASRLLFTGNANSTFTYNASFTFYNNAVWIVEADKSGDAQVAMNSAFASFTPASGAPASLLRLTNGTFSINAGQQIIFSNIEGGGTLQMGNNSSLYLEQHNTLYFNTFYGTVNLHPTSQIIYRSENQQNIFAPSSGEYANLILDGQNNPTPVNKTISGNIEAASLNIINNANLNFQPGIPATVRVKGNLLNLSGASSITQNGFSNCAHTLELQGAVNQVGNFIVTSGAEDYSYVVYNGTTPQQVFAANYGNLAIDGGSMKILQGNATVAAQLQLDNGRLQLGNNNLTLTATPMAGQIAGTFTSSWVETNGSGVLARLGSGTNIIFPVGNAVAARPVTIASVSANAEAAFTTTIAPPVAAANAAAGMWSVRAPGSSTHLTFANVGGTAGASAEIHRSDAPYASWTTVATTPTRPPYTTAAIQSFGGAPARFTIFNACTPPVISLVQDQSAFLCSATAGRLAIYLQPASITPGANYDIDLNNDNVWDFFNQALLSPNILLIDNLPAGTVVNNPRVRIANTACVSAAAPISLTISGKKPVVLEAKITIPTSCAQPDGKITLKIRNGAVGGLYHADINNDGINEFTNLPLANDSTITLTAIAEKTPLPAIKVTYALSACASAPFIWNETMPDAPRPAANLPVSGDNEAAPDEVIAIGVQNIEAGVSYRLMNDAIQIGQPQSGAAGATLTFNTPPLTRDATFHILAKGINSGCEVELEQKISVRVYHEVLDSLTLVALYNSANGVNWQPGWNLQTPVRTWQGVRVRKGRVVSLELNGRGLSGLINPVLQLPRLAALDVGDNQLEFDAFEGVLPALANRGVALNFTPQAPVNEEFSVTEFETKTVTLRAQAKGTRNTYQWFKDDRPIAGATAAELALRNLTIQDAGVYYCEIRNPEAPGLIIQRRRITLNVLQYMRSQTDSLVLVELYRALGGDNWIERFNFQHPVATWSGIWTANGRVVGINLPNNNLVGEIPDIFVELRGLGILDDLEYLNLSGNKITGRIPESLTNHHKLAYLDLSYNLLEGEIPAYIGKFSQLRTLWLAGNKFTRLPREIGQLTELINLLLDDNRLTSLPDEIGQLRKLQILRVSGNQLRDIPAAIAGIFDNLKTLALADNQIESLPAAFDNLPEGLEQLLLHNNQLRTVPLRVAELPRLQLLTIYGNRMDFGVIEPLMLRLRRGTQVLYAPQAPIGAASELTITSGQPFTLTIRTGGAANRYRWFKDDNAIGNDLNIADLTVAHAQADDTGRYWVQVTNPNAPDLTLTSLVTQVQVTCGAATAFNIRAQGATELCGDEPFATILQVVGMENAVEIRWLRNGSLLAGAQGRNFTPQAAGRYRAMARAEGQNCFLVSANEIEIRMVDNVSLAINVAQGGRLFAQVAGSPSVQRYEWFRNGQLVASGTSREFIAEQAGNYAVSLITTSGCRFTSPAVAVDNAIVGIEDWPAVIPMRLYPNPAQTLLKLQSSVSQIEECRIFNALGQAVRANITSQTADEWRLDVSALPPGAYLMRCRTRQGDVWMKWIKE